jgi:hypothetical protein
MASMVVTSSSAISNTTTCKPRIPAGVLYIFQLPAMTGFLKLYDLLQKAGAIIDARAEIRGHGLADIR